MATTIPPSDRNEEDYQVPLMNVFRSAADARDADQKDDQLEGGDKVISARSIERREGASYEKLQNYLMTDLANLMSTVHMEAVEDLSDYPNVRHSILNYGVLDVTRLTREQSHEDSIRQRFKQALLDHEPRLIPESLVVNMREVQGESSHSVSFEVEAVMAARPVDVPLEFVAEIDVGAGKVMMSKLAVQE